MGDCIPGRIKSKPALDQEHQGRVPEAEMLVTENSREWGHRAHSVTRLERAVVTIVKNLALPLRKMEITEILNIG